MRLFFRYYKIAALLPLRLAVIFLFLQLSICSAYSQNRKIVSRNSFINPTGFYELKGVEKGEETYGYFGTAKVKLISNHRIVIRFYICKGYMSYNSGSFYATLKYKDNSAEYRIPELDTSCRIKLRFTKKGLFVDEQTGDYNSGCGFGHAVVAKDMFKLKSKRIPSVKELTEE